jgi:hypothetical protein
MPLKENPVQIDCFLNGAKLGQPAVADHRQARICREPDDRNTPAPLDVSFDAADAAHEIRQISRPAFRRNL